MYYYHIYFSVKAECDKTRVISQSQQFIEQLKKSQKIEGGQIRKITHKANFEDMTDYYIEISFIDELHMINTFEYIKEHMMTTYPHNTLMNSVAEFKVSFSSDIISI